MPRTKGSGKGLNKPITLRLPTDEEDFYRRKANENGLSLSAFLVKTLVAGVVAENVLDIEDRMRELIESIPSETRTEARGLSDEMTLSLLTCEALLTSIVESQDTQTLYAAQEAARTRLNKIKGA